MEDETILFKYKCIQIYKSTFHKVKYIDILAFIKMQSTINTSC